MGSISMLPLVAVTIFLLAIPSVSETSCKAHVVQSWTFPEEVELPFLNPFLVDDEDFTALPEECLNGRDAGTICRNLPAVGSGLTQLGSGLLAGLTDRGPNQDCEDLCDIDSAKYADACGKKGKGFPVRKFAPSFVKFRLTQEGVRVVDAVHLKGMSGAPLSGISNTDADDTPYGPNCVGAPLPFDPNGVDPEDLHEIPSTNGIIALVEEYSPSILLSKPDGTVFARYVPKSIAHLLKGADMKVYGRVPDVFKHRRKNRGFEGLVVSKSGNYLIAILQSPMGDKDVETLANNRILRACVFKIIRTKNSSEPVRLRYKKQFAIEGSPVASYSTEIVPADLKVSAGADIDGDSFLLLERAKGQVKYFNVKWRGADNLDRTRYRNTLDLERAAGSGESVDVVFAEKRKVLDTSSEVPGGLMDFDLSSKQEGVVVLNDGKAILTIDDNDFGLEGKGSVVLNKIKLGRDIHGATVCARPRQPDAVAKRTDRSHVLVLEESIVLSNEPDVAKAEIVAVDKSMGSDMIFTANADTGAVDGYRRTPLTASPVFEFSAGEDTSVNSVDVCPLNGIVAAAVEDKKGGPGRLLLLDLVLETDGTKRSVRDAATYSDPKCFLPDAVKWSDDCSYIVMACEGEGADVPGGVFIWRNSSSVDLQSHHAHVATFEVFDSPKLIERLNEENVRYFQADKPSLSFEPEFSAFTSDNQYAFVALQENNALAVVDLSEMIVSEIKPLIFTKRSIPGFGIDASDKDDMINIRNYPSVFGMCQPDTITSFDVNGEFYLVLACEGDAWDDGVEEIRAADIEADLGRNIDPRLEKLVANEALLGRLEVSFPMGYNAETNTQEALYHFGSRSFQIYDMWGSCVYDSGDWIEKIHEIEYPDIFNAQGSEDDETMKDEFDSRSDAKGPEPEAVHVADIDGRKVLFVGNERTSTIMAFDVTKPTAPVYLASTLQTPTSLPSDEMFAQGLQGIIDPESITYYDGLLYVAAPFSSTISTLSLKRLKDFCPRP